jgi:hypothetical protein
MCWKCGKSQTVTSPVSRSNVCVHCGADIRSCKNCKFFAPGAHYDCHETIYEMFLDKERSNLCDNFSYTEKTKNAQCGQGKEQKARNDFNNLFS